MHEKQNIIMTTRECLKDFFSRFGKVDKLVEFTGVAHDTEMDWRLHNILPNGETLVKVRYFLWLAGYRIKEVEELSTELQILGKCVAFGASSIRALEIETGLTPSHIYRYLNAKQRPGEGRVTLFKRIADRSIDGLNRAIENRRVTYLPALEEARSKMNELNSSKKQETIGSDLTGSSDLVEEFRLLCEKTRECAQKLLEGSRETRFEMRKVMLDMKNPKLHGTINLLRKLTNEGGEI